MKNLKLFLLVFLFAALIIFTGCNSAQIEDSENNSNQADVNSENSEKVILEVDFGNGETENIAVDVNENSTVYSVLFSSGLTLDVKEYDFGILVNGIDGVMGGTDGKYWIYYLNGETGMVAADAAKVEPGDTISWRFEDESSYTGE